MIAYMLEVSICWAGFYILYALLLSRTTFFHANRFYLLGTLLLGLLVPVMEFQAPEAVSEPVAAYLQPLSSGLEQFEVTVTAGAGPDYYALLSRIYWLGVVLTVGRLLSGLWQIGKLYRGGIRERHPGYLLVRTAAVHLPFSFFGAIFWSENLKFEREEARTILRHEQAHITGRHSFDVLFLEMLGILLWCSPFLYFYRRSLRTMHEYLADSVVLQTTRRKKYGHLLLRQSQSGLQIALANHFIQSQLKKRIMMMTRHQTSNRALTHYLLAIPLLLMFLLAFANRELIGQTLLEIHRPDGTVEQHTLANPELADDFLEADQIVSVKVLKASDNSDKIVVRLKGGTDAILPGSPVKPALNGPIQLEIYGPDGSVEKRMIDDPSEINDLDPSEIERMEVLKDQEGKVASRILIHLKNPGSSASPSPKAADALRAAGEEAQAPHQEKRLELDGFSVAPNPTSGQLQVRFRGAPLPTTIRITDLSGREVYRRQIQDFDGLFDQQIDLGEHTGGTVVLTVQQGARLFSEQVIVQ